MSGAARRGCCRCPQCPACPDGEPRTWLIVLSGVSLCPGCHGNPAIPWSSRWAELPSPDPNGTFLLKYRSHDGACYWETRRPATGRWWEYWTVADCSGEPDIDAEVAELRVRVLIQAAPAGKRYVSIQVDYLDADGYPVAGFVGRAAHYDATLHPADAPADCLTGFVADNDRAAPCAALFQAVGGSFTATPGGDCPYVP